MTNEDIQDRIKVIDQLREAEGWLETWNSDNTTLGDDEIENRIKLINLLREAEAEVEA